MILSSISLKSRLNFVSSYYYGIPSRLETKPEGISEQSMKPMSPKGAKKHKEFLFS